MKPKVLLIILGVLVVLFLVGTGLNVGRALDEDGEPASTPAWGDTVRGLLEQPLDVDDVKIAFPSACRQQLQAGAFELPAEGQCEMVITEAGTNLRVLSLELAEGAGADVTMDPASEDRLATDARLNAGRGETAVTVSIFKEGGTLRIACAGGAACRLVVGE
jgi:hypothetical protein